MEKLGTLLLIDGNSDYREFYSNLFDVTEDIDRLFETPESLAAVAFTGGEDVSPELYGESNVCSYNNVLRDEYEMGIYRLCRDSKIPMIGICRGSQFLNVMSGGRMVQHLDNHSGIHSCQTYTGDTIIVTSTHHQMSLLGPSGILLAEAKPRLSNRYLTGKGDIEVEYETEAFVYPDKKVIGFQFHPEMVLNFKDDPVYSCVEWSLNIIKKLFKEDFNVSGPRTAEYR